MLKSTRPVPFKILIVCVSSLLIWLPMSCKKQPCTDDTTTYHYLNKSEVKEVSLKPSDTLYFFDENNDTLVFFPTDSNTYFNTQSTSTTCTGVSEKFEGLQYLFETSNLRALYHNQYVPFDLKNGSTIAVTYYDQSFNMSIITLRYPYTKYEETINGKVYRDVRMVNIGTDTLYYSLQSGIIRLHLTNQNRLLQLQ